MIDHLLEASLQFITVVFGGALSVRIAGNNSLARWTVTIFYLMASLYYVGIPLSYVVDGFFSGNSTVHIEEWITWRLIFGTVMAGPAFSLGLRAFFPKNWNGENLKPDQEATVFNGTNSTRSKSLSHHFGLRSLAQVFWMVAILWLVYFWQEIAESGSYEGNYATIYTAPLYALSTIVLCAYACGLFVQISGHQAYAYAALVLLWGLYSSDKNPILYLAIASLMRFGILRNSHWRRLSLTCAAFAIGIFIFIPLFSHFRSAGITGINYELVKQARLENMDMAGPFISLIDIADREYRGTIKYELGKSYIDGFLILIPKAVFPNRPIDISERYAKDNISNWSEGQGMGFSPMAEAILNFGYWSIPLHYFVSGVLISLMIRLLQWSLKRTPRSFATVTTGMLLLYAVVIMHRGPLISPIKDIILIGSSLSALAWISMLITGWCQSGHATHAQPYDRMVE